MHVFKCGAKQCHSRKPFIHRYLDTSNSRLTSNLQCHAKACWGDEVVDAADDTKDKNVTSAALQDLKTKNGSIMAAFQQVSKGKAMYSHCQHTEIEAWYAQLKCSFDKCLKVIFSAEFVRWVSENNQPFQIVNDQGFRSLMKTGRPEYHIPFTETLSCNVKNVFIQVRGRIAKSLQVRSLQR